MRCTVRVKGRIVTFESPYTDDEVLAILRGHMARGRITSSFADDLLKKGEQGRQLTRAQLDWVHKLVFDSESRGANRPAREITGQTRKPGSHKWTHPGT